MAEIVIRPVGKSERAAWEPLWNGYLAFYNATLAPDASDITWQRFHDPEEQMFPIMVQFAGDERVGHPLLADARAGAMTADESDIVADHCRRPDRKRLRVGDIELLELDPVSICPRSG